MRYLITLLLLIAFTSPAYSQYNMPDLTPPAEPAELQLLVEGLEAVTPLWGGWILYSAASDENESGEIRMMNTATGQSYPWACDWDPVAEGWAGFASHPVYELRASPNGQWVCLMVGVELPADVELTYESMRFCEALLLCQADGSQARVVALSIMVGGGPYFDFTADGAYVVGSPFLQCIPDAAHYAAFINRDPDAPEDYAFNRYSLATGQREFVPDVDTGDGYWKCPYSDNFRIENNWYAEHRFSNFATGGLLGEYIVPGENPGGFISGWVLPDALLFNSSNGCGLLYVDGTFVPAPADVWDVYCWLPDGSYVFSDDDGATMKYGKVDWPTFSGDWWVDLPGMDSYSDYQFIALRDSSGAVLQNWATGDLLLLPLSRDNAKP